MSQPVPAITPITKNPLITEAFAITQEVYALLPELPEEEKWDTTTKLRRLGNNLLLDITLAVSNAAPSGSEYDWSSSRKDAAGLLTMCRFADKQRFVSVDAGLLLRINELIQKIDLELQDSYQRSEAYQRYELSLWQEKYEAWQLLHNEITS